MNEAKKLLSNSTIIFGGTILGSVCAYAFNMLSGRLLGPKLYGEFTALLSLMAILSVAGGAIMTVTMKYVSDLYADKHFKAIKKLYWRFSKYILFFAVGLFLISTIFVRSIANFLSIDNIYPVIITLSTFIFGFLIVVNRGVLQGTQKFLIVSLTSVLEMLLRLSIGLVLIKIGLGVGGALLGIVVASVVTYFITFLPLLKIFKTKDDNDTPFVFKKKEILSYSIPALFSSLFLAVALNLDVILVKHYFEAETAGLYAAVSTIGKIILYATGPIATVMFPMIAEKQASGDKHYSLFLFSLLLTIIGSFIILLIYFIAPGTVIRILYGDRYTGLYELLPKIGLFVLFYALVNLMANYFMVAKKYWYLGLFAIDLILQFVLIAKYHSDLETVVKILSATTGLLFLSMIGYYLFTKREQLQQLLRSNAEE